MWSKLGTRLISAIIGAILLVAFIFASSFVFNIAVAIASVLVLYELFLTFGQEKKWPLLVLGYGFAAIILSSLFVGSNIFTAGDLTLILVLYLILLSISAVLWNEKIKFYDVAVSFFILVYSVIMLYHAALLRAAEHGIVLIFIPFLGAWMTDTFAYFSGICLGRHKLIPKVSPNKTVEGAIGGILGCVLMFFVYALIVSTLGYKVNYILLTVLALLCGVVAQFGDLTASLIKRECNKKDFGNLIPGHGGMLDRIDSFIFVLPIVYYFLQVFEVIYI